MTILLRLGDYILPIRVLIHRALKIADIEEVGLYYCVWSCDIYCILHGIYRAIKRAFAAFVVSFVIGVCVRPSPRAILILGYFPIAISPSIVKDSLQSGSLRAEVHCPVGHKLIRSKLATVPYDKRLAICIDNLR